MYIDNISLVNFRNYDNLTLKLKQELIIWNCRMIKKAVGKIIIPKFM